MCKRSNKDGFWVDVAIDESISMDTYDPYDKAQAATFGLIEELSLKVDKFNNLEKRFILIFILSAQELLLLTQQVDQLLK